MRRYYSSQEKYWGFSLIEILVTITIIVLLSTIGVTGYQAVARGGRDALRKTDLEQIRSALEIYKSENNAYPGSTSPCEPDLPVEYINPRPEDPKYPTFRYCYRQITSLSYELCAHLENGDASDFCDANFNCNPDPFNQINCNYSVANP